RGPRIAEDFAPRLVKLPVAPLLRALGAEHRAEIVPAADGLFRVHFVLDVRARDAGRPLGPQRELVAVVRERVHLFLDDVGHFSDLPDEEGRWLDERRAHLFVTIELDRGPKGPFETVPPPDFVGEDVVHPLDGPKVHTRSRRLWSGGPSG